MTIKDILDTPINELWSMVSGFAVSDLDIAYSEHLEKLLTSLYNAGENHGKNIYVTMQTGLNHEQLGDKKLVVIDY